MSLHPSITDLTDYVDHLLNDQAAANVEAHLETCATCRAAVRNAGVIGDPAPLARFDAPPVGPPWKPYSQSLPEPGQIWRISWDDVTLLAVVGRAPAGLQAMIRLTVDDDDLDILGVRVSVELAGGSLDICVMRAAVWAPLAAFDECVGTLQQELDPPEELLDLSELPNWMETQLPPWADDFIIDLVDELAADLAALARADWTPVRSPSAKIELDTAQLLDIGIGGPRAIALARGAAPLENERPSLVSLGIDPDVLAAVPADVRAELDRPVHKSRVVALARRRRVSEAQIRNELATELRLPIAARIASGAQVTIADRLKALLDE